MEKVEKLGAPKIALEEIVVPKGIFDSKDLKIRDLAHRYAVLYKLAEDSDPEVIYQSEEKDPTLENPKYRDMVKKAIPGLGKSSTQSSYLFGLHVLTNINEQTIESKNLSLKEKLSNIADSMSKFIIISN